MSSSESSPAVVNHAKRGRPSGSTKKGNDDAPPTKKIRSKDKDEDITMEKDHPSKKSRGKKQAPVEDEDVTMVVDEPEYADLLTKDVNQLTFAHYHLMRAKVTEVERYWDIIKEQKVLDMQKRETAAIVENKRMESEEKRKEIAAFVEDETRKTLAQVVEACKMRIEAAREEKEAYEVKLRYMQEETKRRTERRRFEEY
ncbi:hypothetical protein CPB83DRAFT_851458 [Crepidotus variabilis]|uniref:Uncharacterized protein n=1 Tax=Crepidotus variabilis TaxID=179855 RepID=A0A9P6EJK3_9AGAR|nr:hypothetical protein CPB83DRAFT_851458 [Crepidotus variabilis]